MLLTHLTNYYFKRSLTNHESYEELSWVGPPTLKYLITYICDITTSVWIATQTHKLIIKNYFFSRVMVHKTVRHHSVCPANWGSHIHSNDIIAVVTEARKSNLIWEPVWHKASAKHLKVIEPQLPNGQWWCTGQTAACLFKRRGHVPLRCCETRSSLRAESFKIFLH